MDFDRIEGLLDKYWACETSLEEEKELRDFFSENTVPEKFRSVAPLFDYYNGEGEDSKLDEKFSEEVLNIIEKDNKIITEASAKRGKVVALFYNISKVAAVILILMVAGYFVREEYREREDEVKPYLADTFEDPKEAFEETKKALMMISKNFNKGRKEVQKMGAFEDAQKKIKNKENKL